MAWRDHIRPATFRGALFHVAVAELAGGRRTVKHEFPLRDEPFVEDLGRKGRNFRVDGYVLGPEYFAAKNALIDKLEQPGPGELVHPYYGVRRVIAGNFVVRETKDDGGIAYFSIDFDETPAQPVQPSGAADGTAAVGGAADAASEAFADDFLDTFIVDDAPAFSLESLEDLVRQASTALDEAMAPIVRETQELALLKNRLDNLFLNADGLVRRPFDLLADYRRVFESLSTVPATPSLGIKALLRAYGFMATPGAPPNTTPTRRREAANYAVLLGLAQTLTVVEAARLAPRARFASHEDAVAARDAIALGLDDVAERASDASFGVLVDLRAQLVAAVPGDDNRLPRLLRHTPAYTRPSLALAYSLYGDVASEAEIVARNRIRHPGFVAGGVPLQILSRV